MNTAYFKLSIAALLPVIASAILYLLDKKTSFGKLNNKAKQLIFGLVFGCLAVVGTEWGIPLNGVQVNCRDAAVLTAGLLFGAPAGIIAGVIGGVERWIAVYWGVGSFTRIACSVSTVIAGIYSAFLRKYMFEDKKPGRLISLAIGLVMETFHLTMVFITNLKDPINAMYAVKVSTVPMLLSNGISLLLSTVLICALSKEKMLVRPEKLRISQTIQRWLFLTVLLAFLTTTVFLFSLQSKVADAQIDSFLTTSLDDIAADISDASDENLLELTYDIYDEINANGLKSIKKLSDEEKENIISVLSSAAEKYDVAEISLVGKNKRINLSNIKKYIGFDMSSGKQSAEFLCLLGDTQEFVQGYGSMTSDRDTSRKYAGIKTDWGFLQVGYDGERFQKDIYNQVKTITKNRRIGDTGWVFIFDETHGIVGTTEMPDSKISKEKLLESGFISDFKKLAPEEASLFTMNILGSLHYCRYITNEGYYIFSVMPAEEALRTRNVVLYVNTFSEILVFAILFALIYFLVKKVIVNRIADINSSLSKITDGDLDETVNVRSNEEFASLSDDINSTVSALKHYIEEASARIDRELEFAKNIQRSVLPNIYPAFSERTDFDIYALMDTAKEVGGDFYDFYFIHKNRLNFLIADVSGKGIPAAMFMMRAKTELKRFTEADISTGDIFTNSNAALCEGNDAGMFVTAWQAGVDLKTGLVEFANAGHNPPLIKRKNGKFEFLKSRAGFVLAGMEGVQYKNQTLQLEKGDIIYLYTDGVTEATNAQDELYGEDRLLSAINSKEFDDMQKLCEFIKKDVDGFVGDAPQFDDITMVAFKYIGKDEN